MNTTAPITTVPAITTQAVDLMSDLTGFHPVLDRIVSDLGQLLAADLDADQSQTLVAALGGFEDGNLRTLVAMVVQHLGSPDTNPALVDLPEDRQQTLRRLGAEHVAAVDDPALTRTAAEMSAVIDGV
jgi:hypothetical protein